MAASKDSYSINTAIDDIETLFQIDEHWAFQYGSKAVNCNKDSVFYKKQLQIIFEEKYPHDITGKAVNELINKGFLKAESRTFNKNVPIVFVYRKNLRYVARQIKEKITIIENFSSDEMNDGAGKYAEILFYHMFNKHGFNIIAKNTNQFGDTK